MEYISVTVPCNPAAYFNQLIPINDALEISPPGKGLITIYMCTYIIICAWWDFEKKCHTCSTGCQRFMVMQTKFFIYCDLSLAPRSSLAFCIQHWDTGGGVGNQANAIHSALQKGMVWLWRQRGRTCPSPSYATYSLVWLSGRQEQDVPTARRKERVLRRRVPAAMTLQPLNKGHYW